MNENGLVLGTVLWLLVYPLLAVGRQYWAHWVIVRLHGRRPPRSLQLRLKLGRSSTVRSLLIGLGAVGGLLAGALLPLFPLPANAPLQLPAHVWGAKEGSLLLALSLQWGASALLAVSAGTQTPAIGRIFLSDLASTWIVGALPIFLVVLALIIASSAFFPASQMTWSIALLLRSQGGWGGWRWMGIVQPLGLGLWAACSWALPTEAMPPHTWAARFSALNRNLLTAILFLGGWHGPWSEQAPPLGALYLLLKVGAIAALEAWLGASIAKRSLDARQQSMWAIAASLALLNLLVTAWVCWR
jgi:hypothetical protein